MNDMLGPRREVRRFWRERIGRRGRGVLIRENAREAEYAQACAHALQQFAARKKMRDHREAPTGQSTYMNSLLSRTTCARRSQRDSLIAGISSGASLAY